MRAVLLAALLSACATTTPAWRQVVLVADAALIGCDSAQTQWFADGGKYDRDILEGDPVLGTRPSSSTIAISGLLAELSLAVVERADVPRWTRDAWAVGVLVVESAAVSRNASIGAGVCGLGGRR